ncbi:hypothetical protein EMEDMD4_980009 [Sinorhizobium medicae]|uniref:Uncharacterized protein n=1 Tax=Sinorhizobium medicae TaxID=110321 RepID=A0A508XC99_9HYPH|nr:hypothetical protein EMEDMD4_980009 [Sinorhizobium medicae]
MRRGRPEAQHRHDNIRSNLFQQWPAAQQALELMQLNGGGGFGAEQGRRKFALIGSDAKLRKLQIAQASS